MPISLLAPVLPASSLVERSIPSLAALALAASTISSCDIWAGRSVCIIASSSFSATASSGRPPFSNCSIESLRCLDARTIIASISSAVISPSGPRPLATSSLVTMVEIPRRTFNLTVSRAFIAVLIASLSSVCVMQQYYYGLAGDSTYYFGSGAGWHHLPVLEARSSRACAAAASRHLGFCADAKSDAPADSGHRRQTFRRHTGRRGKQRVQQTGIYHRRAVRQLGEGFKKPETARQLRRGVT